jgi:hypothetical protein
MTPKGEVTRNKSVNGKVAPNEEIGTPHDFRDKSIFVEMARGKETALDFALTFNLWNCRAIVTRMLGTGRLYPK